MSIPCSVPHCTAEARNVIGRRLLCDEHKAAAPPTATDLETVVAELALDVRAAVDSAYQYATEEAKALTAYVWACRVADRLRPGPKKVDGE